MKNKPRTILLLCCALFIAGWLLYANTLSNKFAFDDKSLIVNNKLVNESSTLKQIFTSSYRSGVGYTGDALYRPLVILSFVLNNRGGSLQPGPYHFVNISLNALNGVLVFLLFLILTKSTAVSLIGALIFAFHPVHTEVVANNAGRPEIMCSLFLFLSWILFENGKSGKFRWLMIPASLSFFAALLSKETAVVLPFLIIIADIIRRRDFKDKQIILKSLLLVSTFVIYMVIRMSVLSGSSGIQIDFVDNPIADSPALERIATSFSVFLRYVLLLIAPVRLSSDYSYNQLPVYSSLLHLIPILSVVVLSGIVAGAWYCRKKNPVYLLGSIIFLFPWVLISNIVFPIGTIMGERLMYLPSAGFSLAIGALIAGAARKWRYPACISFAILLIAFSAKTITRNGDWRDDHSLFSADMKNSPGSVKILCNMGFLSGSNGDHRAGENYYRKALEIYPGYDVAYRGLAKRLYDQRRFEESAKNYARAVEISPEKSMLRYDFATVLEKLNRYDQAEQELLKAIELDPSAPKPYEEMGTVKIGQEQYFSAIEYLEQALLLDGNKRLIFNNLAAAYYYLGKYGEAHKYIMEAEKNNIRLNPEMVKTIKSLVKNR